MVELIKKEYGENLTEDEIIKKNRRINSCI